MRISWRAAWLGILISAGAARAYPVANGWDTDRAYVIRADLYQDGANLNPQVPGCAIAIYNDPPLSVVEEQAYITRFGTMLVGSDIELKSLTFSNAQSPGTHSPSAARLFVAEPWPQGGGGTKTDILVREFNSNATEVRRAFVGAAFGGGAGNLAGALKFGSIRYNPKKETLAVSATINSPRRGKVFEFALPDWVAGSPATGTLTAVQAYEAPAGHSIADAGQPFQLDFDDEGWLYLTGKSFNANAAGDTFMNDVVRVRTVGLSGGGTTVVSITGPNAANLLIEGGVENQTAEYSQIHTLAVRPASRTLVLMKRPDLGNIDAPTFVYSLDPPRAANGNLRYVTTLGPEGTNQSVTHAQRDRVNGAVLVGCYRGDGPGGGAKRINPTNSVTFMVGYRSWDMASPPANDWTPPAPLIGFISQAGAQSVTLSWTNPPDTDFKGTVVRFRTDAFPVGPGDGLPLVDRAGTPGGSEMMILTDLTPGTTCYYAAFPYDSVRNYGPPSTSSAAPGSLADLDADGDVDLADFARLQACFGSTFITGTLCETTDLSGDTVVDGADFTIFLPCLNGSNRPPGC